MPDDNRSRDGLRFGFIFSNNWKSNKSHQLSTEQLSAHPSALDYFRFWAMNSDKVIVP